MLLAHLPARSLIQIKCSSPYAAKFTRKQVPTRCTLPTD